MLLFLRKLQQRQPDQKPHVNGPHQDIIGNFDCKFDANRTTGSVSWILKNNSYYTPNGNASLPCGISVAAAAASGTGVEEGSSAHRLPTDDQLVAMARLVLGMKTDVKQGHLLPV